MHGTSLDQAALRRGTVTPRMHQGQGELPMVRTATILSATGQLGTGFLPETLDRAMAMGPDMIGCDAGSTDGGPYFLGSGIPKASRDAMGRDLELMLRAARAKGVPMLVGSAGTGGASPHLAVVREVFLEAAKRAGLHFRLGVVDSEVSREQLRRAHREGRLRPLPPWKEVPESAVEECDPVVAQIGVEHFAEALRQGADVVLTGRATDAAIFATIPEMMGLPSGPSWHAAKVLECGAACVEHRTRPDCMVAVIDEEGFTVRPPNSEHRCSPQSVAAQTLYENSDPFLITEPSGILDTGAADYRRHGDREVRVTGSRFLKKPFDLKLEGVRFTGYRSVVIGGIRDPYVIRGIDAFTEGARRTILEKVEHSLGLRAGTDYALDLRVYGRDGTLGHIETASETSADAKELAMLFSVVAKSQERSRDIAAIAWHTALHYPIPEWSGLVSNLAFPFSPPHLDAGPVYEFGMQATYTPKTSPLEIGKVTIENV